MTAAGPNAPVHLNGTPVDRRVIAIVGNPNVGKTTLFNALAGRRQKTANFPGTTQEAHVGHVPEPDGITLIDLPGVYSLHLTLTESELCRGVLEGSVAPLGRRASVPDAALIVLDATNLSRGLRLVGEVARRGTPVVLAVTMIDRALRLGVRIDRERLSRELGVPVVLVDARRRSDVETLSAVLDAASPAHVPRDAGTTGQLGDQLAGHLGGQLDLWADELFARVAAGEPLRERDTLHDRLDRAFTHPVLGVLAFVAIMAGLFWLIFRVAEHPMGWIEGSFGSLGAWLQAVLPAGAVADLLVDGVVMGVAGAVVFLPQIVMLFFLVSLLEQSGYLARASFVIDRLLRPFGLPGQAFVPLLSAHACALPAIMSARAVPDRRDRLATILVIPFMSCSARIPVYALLVSLLFPASPGTQALAFVGCYALGVVGALITSVLFRRTVLRGKSRPMALELPAYARPRLIVAAREAGQRGLMFLKKAGTLIVALSMVLWWLGAYPTSGPSAEGDALRAQADTQPERAEDLLAQADAADASHAAARSFLGRAGSFVQPAFAPLGADERLTIGILASFAAREVFVSTLAVQVAGSDDAEDAGVIASIRAATRRDGSPLFDRATAWSMLVYFVLAMQCLPTLVVTAREAGHWKWAAAQFVWMSLVAYAAAAAVYAILR